MKNILIVGSDSLIGRALMAYLRTTGKNVIGTTRRRNKLEDSRIYLNLSDDLEEWKCPTSFDVAVVCAGVTKIETCKRDPLGTAKINVNGVAKLINNLVAKGIFVIYISTNLVFDGSKPYRLPDEPFSPITEYGRQKAEVEHLISQWEDSVAIVRFTKVIGSENSLFSAWTKSLLKGEVIYPFLDMFMAPVPLFFTILVLSLVTDKLLPGILQVSGNKDISYAEAAQIGAQLLSVNKNLVKPILSSQSGHCPEYNSPNTTLNIERLKLELGIEPPDVYDSLKMAFTKPQFLAESYITFEGRK